MGILEGTKFKCTQLKLTEEICHEELKFQSSYVFYTVAATTTITTTTNNNNKVGHTSLLSLTKAAIKELQAAYAALTKSFQNEWTFLQHVISGCDNAFCDLESTLFADFLPVLFGCEKTPSEHKLFSLPTWLGDLGIVDHTKSALRSSMHATVILTVAIKEGFTFDLNSHVNTVLMAKHQDVLSRGACYKQQFDHLLNHSDSSCQKSEYFYLVV